MTHTALACCDESESTEVAQDKKHRWDLLYVVYSSCYFSGFGFRGE